MSNAWCRWSSPSSWNALSCLHFHDVSSQSWQERGGEPRGAPVGRRWLYVCLLRSHLQDLGRRRQQPWRRGERERTETNKQSDLKLSSSHTLHVPLMSFKFNKQLMPALETKKIYSHIGKQHHFQIWEVSKQTYTNWFCFFFLLEFLILQLFYFEYFSKQKITYLIFLIKLTIMVLKILTLNFYPHTLFRTKILINQPMKVWDLKLRKIKNLRLKNGFFQSLVWVYNLFLKWLFLILF